MRAHLSLIVAVSLSSLTACESGTDPSAAFAPDDSRRSSISLSASYTGTLLPDGDMTGVRQPSLELDDDGRIFGSISIDGNGFARAVRWAADASGAVSGPVLLGVLPPPFDKADQTVFASNPDGLVVGTADDPEAGLTAGWSWKAGTMIMLQPTPGPEYSRVVPLGIGEDGTIVGQVRTVSGDEWQAYGAVWLPPYDSPPVLLPRLETHVINDARAITSDGVITGWVRGYDVADAYVQWRIDLYGNVLSGPTRLDRSEDQLPSGVNANLDVAGTYHGAGQEEASLYRTETAWRISLGTLEGHTLSRARGLTERDEHGAVAIVGRSGTDVFDSRPALWSIDADGTVFGPVDLGLPAAYPNNSPSNRFTSAGAQSVNGLGWAVGWSRRADGAMFATLWQPDATEVDPPPSGEGPVASFEYSCGSSDTCQFTDTSAPGAAPIATWLWDSGDGQFADTQNAAFTFGAEGSHAVTLTVTDANGLADTSSTTITCSMHPRRGLRCS